MKTRALFWLGAAALAWFYWRSKSELVALTVTGDTTPTTTALGSRDAERSPSGVMVGGTWVKTNDTEPGLPPRRDADLPTYIARRLS